MECYCLDNFQNIFWGQQATLKFLPFEMPSTSEEKRKRVVHFLNRVMGTRADWRKFTADHFMAEGVPKTTVYNIIKVYLAWGSVERRRGSGRPAVKMTMLQKRRLKRMVNHKTGISQRALASTFSCHYSFLEPHLIPFLNTHYPNGGYIFWPDKASAHYARVSTAFLDNNSVNYVEKADNPTEVPQCRPIEDFFGLLATRVYHRNWVAKDVPALKRRILKCLSEIPQATVQATLETVRKRLLRAYRVGILQVCH